jgi:glutamine cyclotransferase
MVTLNRARAWQTFPIAALILWGAGVYVARAAVPVYDFEVVHTYPHDPAAFTEGLFYLNGFLYESTGLERHSSIRKVRLDTGEVVQKVDIAEEYFGEGIVNWGNHLVSLTWKSRLGFVFDLSSLKLQRQFHYDGEGWALTQDGKQLIMSDGTSTLRLLDPTTLRQTGRLEVTLNGKPVPNLNELEWVKGQIFANVWHANWIARIDPASGHVVGLINLTGLLSPTNLADGPDGVLNGIAYDARGDRLFVTGKNWPTLFEIKLHERATGAAPTGAAPTGAAPTGGAPTGAAHSP